MLKKKKAQGLSVRFIIMAVISLIVIVTLLFIFSGNFGNFTFLLREYQTCNEVCQIKGHFGGISDGPKYGYEILVGSRNSDGDQCYCKT